METVGLLSIEVLSNVDHIHVMQVQSEGGGSVNEDDGGGGRKGAPAPIEGASWSANSS